MSEKTLTIVKIICSVLLAVAAALGTAFGLSSCNVTRVITTEAKTYQSGDSTFQVVTKTTEMYDAAKKTNL